MSTWPQLLGEDRKLLDGGIGTPHKILEAYIDEAMWSEHPEAYLATLLWVIIVLLWQHEDQLKDGLPWMEL